MRENNLILVVDDSPTVLHGTCRILQKAGYETIEASTGMDGLRLTIEHKPDLVLLDVVLPDIYGYEVCRRIKAESDLAGTLVILISSLDTHEDHETHGLEIGADGYIARPVSNSNLLAHIKSLLRLKAAEENLRQSELKFRTVADFTYDWEYWIAPDGGILYMSPSSNRITGYQRDEFVNNPELLIDIIHKDDRAQCHGPFKPRSNFLALTLLTFALLLATGKSDGSLTSVNRLSTMAVNFWAEELVTVTSQTASGWRMNAWRWNGSFFMPRNLRVWV